MTRRQKIIMGAWIAAIAIALTLDGMVASRVRQWGTDEFLRSHNALRESSKAPGFYAFTSCLVILVCLRHPQTWRAGVMFFLTTASSGFNELLKWFFGRARPFKTITGESTSLTPYQMHMFPPLGSKNLSFPSGHAALAFATAAALSILWPRGKWFFYPLAALVAAERVLENAHWLSDTVAAAAVGIGCVTVVRQLVWPKRSGELKNE